MAGLTFMFAQAIDSGVRYSNAVWADSQLRAYLQGTGWDNLPQTVRSSIVSVSKWSSGLADFFWGDSKEWYETQDTLFLLNHGEYGGRMGNAAGTPCLVGADRTEKYLANVVGFLRNYALLRDYGGWYQMITDYPVHNSSADTLMNPAFCF